MIRHTLSVSAAGLVLAWAVSAASAASVISAHLDSVTPGPVVSLKFAAGSGSGYVGSINWSSATALGGDANATALIDSLGTSFATFCIEGTQDVHLSTTENWSNVGTADTTSSDISAAQTLLEARPFGEAAMGADNAAELINFYRAYYTDAMVVGGNDLVAFQLGVWEIRYDWSSADSGLGSPTADDLFKDGNFQITSSYAAASDLGLAAQQARDWILDLPSVTQLDNLRFWVLSDPASGTGTGIQDQIVVQQLTGGTLVPLPAALPAGLGLLGGLGLVQHLRRRFKKA